MFSMVDSVAQPRARTSSAPAHHLALLGSGDAAPPSLSGDPIQRKLGFEFETANLVHELEIKQRIFEDADLRIEADTEYPTKNGNGIEFVIREAANPAESLLRIDRAVAVADGLNEKSAQAQGGTFSAKSAGGVNFKAEYDFTIPQPKWEATPQVTVGVPLNRMGAYLAGAYSRSTDEDETHKVQSLADRHTSKIQHGDGPPVRDETKASEDGFVVLVSDYIRRLKAWAPQEGDEGPKNALVAMSRTDFRSMVDSLLLGGDRRGALKARVEAAARLIVGQNLNQLVIPAEVTVQYVDSNERETEPTTIKEWIDSIFEHADEPKKDKLSPPSLYAGVENPAYSMGAMGMDRDRVLLEERRNMLFGGDVTKDQWGLFVEGMFEELDPAKPEGVPLD